MIGGYNKTSSESYSCSVTFADTEPLERPGAAVLNNQLYYCGGFDTDKIDVTDKCFKNDGGNWVAVPSMNDPKFSQTMTSVGSYILVTGGYSYNRDCPIAPLDTVEIFDGAVWVKLPYTLSSVRENHCAVPLSNTEILVIGGSFDSDTLVAEKYNIFTGEMSSIPSSSDERYAHACALFNGEVYVSGGVSSTILSGVEGVEVLNLETLTWRTISPMNTRRRDHTMEVVNGELTVFGGYNGNAGELDTIEKLIGTTWQTQTETLKLARSNHASAVVDC